MKRHLLFLLYLSAFSLTVAETWAQNAPPAPLPPAHPATEATMRRLCPPTPVSLIDPCGLSIQAAKELHRGSEMP
jgi:hypothetical protein